MVEDEEEEEEEEEDNEGAASDTWEVVLSKRPAVATT